VDAPNISSKVSAGWIPLIDVSEISMAEMIASQNAILGRCIDRLVGSLDDPDGIISAFQSFVE
jgi:hypothetical protein